MTQVDDEIERALRLKERALRLAATCDLSRQRRFLGVDMSLQQQAEIVFDRASDVVMFGIGRRHMIMDHKLKGDTMFEEDYPTTHERTGTPLFDPLWVKAFLEQGAMWKTGAKSFVKISDMTPKHALNAAAWMVDNATMIYLALLIGTTPVDEAPFIESLTRELPRREITASPLFAALLARAGEYARNDTAPWERPTATLR